MHKERIEQLEFEGGLTADYLVKVVAAAFAGLVVAGGVFGGTIFLMTRTTVTLDDARWSLPSLQGMLASVHSGGRIKPGQWDTVMEGVCTQVAGVGFTVRGGEDDSASRAAAKRSARDCRGGTFASP